MSKATVLIGFAEAIAAPEVAWSLFDDSFRVVAFGRPGRHSALRYSKHVEYHELCAPESDLKESLSELHALVISLDGEGDGAKTVLLPLDDTSLLLCSRLPPDPRWRLAGPQGHAAEFALNKQFQTQMAREAGFYVPRGQVVRSAAQLLRLGSTERFPIVLKPVECVPICHGHVRRCKIWICADETELKRAISEWAERVPLLVQPFIAGTGEGLFGFATSRGVYAWSAHRRLRMMNPQGSGSSACVSNAVDSELIARAEDLVERAQWRGLFMIEFLRDEVGIPWFIEFNGRPWGSMALSRRQGFEYPAWQAGLALGSEPVFEKKPASASGVVCRHAGRELMHLLFVFRGPKSKAFGNWPSFWKSVGKVIRVRWRDTWYNWRREDPKVFLVDVYFTLRDNLVKAKS